MTTKAVATMPKSIGDKILAVKININISLAYLKNSIEVINLTPKSFYFVTYS